VTATTGNITTVNATDVNTRNVTGDGTGTISGFTSVSAGTGSFTTVTATTGNITTVNSTNINNSGKITTGTLETTGLAKLNSLEVTNGADIKGNASVGGSLTVAKGATVSESFTVTQGAVVNLGDSVTGNVVHGVATPVVGTDAANKQYVDDGLAKAFKAIDRNTQGIAIAMAMAGLALPEGKNFALGANMGFFDDKQAIAIQAAIRVSPNVTVTGGFGTGVQDMNATGGRVGVQAAW
jgi:trimeric autotransporter adhesin